MTFTRITVDAKQMGGVPCIRSLRIPVATVVGMVADGMTRDEILDNIMLYWLTNSGASSARLYWESFASQVDRLRAGVSVPAGFSLFPKELVRPPKAWVEKAFTTIIHWNRLSRGGHFAAFEQPALFADEVRRCFRALRP